MKQNELKKCATCGKGVMHSGDLIFYRVTVERMCVNLPAVQRQAGLEMMLGGHAAIAAVMGPDEDMAAPLNERATFIVCQDCSVSSCVAELDQLSIDQAQ
jgi:hypothetical protein